jgi:hypothetical protein
MAGRTRALATACKDLEQDLVLLHYGDLAQAERAALQSHLESCAGCAAYLRELDSLLPRTIERDAPDESFWNDYSRDLRHKLDAAAERSSWAQFFAALFQPRLISAFAGAAVIAMALTFTIERRNRPLPDFPQDDEAILEAMPVAENLEFFKSMDMLDDLDWLESMSG